MKLLLRALIILIMFPATALFAQTPLDSDQPIAVANALSGWATAIDGNWAAVASPQKDEGTLQSMGDVTLYNYSNGKWGIRQVVQPSGLPALSNFGISLDLSGNTMIASSIGDHRFGLFSGAIYLYELQSEEIWLQTGKLKGSDVGMGHRFGYATDLEDNLLIAGAYMGDGPERTSGTAYIFERQNDTWIETAKLDASDGKSNDYFGHSVQIIDENTVVVGAYRAEGATDQSGAVYIFSRDNDEWIQTAKLFEAQGSSFDVFGYSLASFNTTDIMGSSQRLLFVGATGSQTEDGQTGSVHLFHEQDGEWSYHSKFVHEQVADNGHFGSALAANRLGDLYVGATRTHSESQRQTGSVFAYHIKIEENILTLSPNLEITAEEEDSYQHFGAVVSATDEFLLISSPYDNRTGITNSGSIQFYGNNSVANYTDPEVISTFELFQNYPNPFNPSTQISYQVPALSEVTLRVYDLLGRQVATLINREMKNPGRYTVTFDAGNLASGVYIYRFETESMMITKKLLLIK